MVWSWSRRRRLLTDFFPAGDGAAVRRTRRPGLSRWKREQGARWEFELEKSVAPRSVPYGGRERRGVRCGPAGHLDPTATRHLNLTAFGIWHPASNQGQWRPVVGQPDNGRDRDPVGVVQDERDVGVHAAGEHRLHRRFVGASCPRALASANVLGASPSCPASTYFDNHPCTASALP
jgi:hypothetical protein